MVEFSVVKVLTTLFLFSFFSCLNFRVLEFSDDRSFKIPSTEAENSNIKKSRKCDNNDLRTRDCEKEREAQFCINTYQEPCIDNKKAICNFTRISYCETIVAKFRDPKYREIFANLNCRKLRGCVRTLNDKPVCAIDRLNNKTAVRFEDKCALYKRNCNNESVYHIWRGQQKDRNCSAVETFKEFYTSKEKEAVMEKYRELEKLHPGMIVQECTTKKTKNSNKDKSKDRDYFDYIKDLLEPITEEERFQKQVDKLFNQALNKALKDNKHLTVEEKRKLYEESKTMAKEIIKQQKKIIEERKKELEEAINAKANKETARKETMDIKDILAAELKKSSNNLIVDVFSNVVG